jgi:hypothetical protein
MTKSLISFPANLEMVNNETDVTGFASRVPGARTMTMDATTAASSPSNSMPGCGVGRPRLLHAGLGAANQERQDREVGAKSSLGLEPQGLW